MWGRVGFHEILQPVGLEGSRVEWVSSPGSEATLPLLTPHISWTTRSETSSLVTCTPVPHHPCHRFLRTLVLTVLLDGLKANGPIRFVGAPPVFGSGLTTTTFGPPTQHGPRDPLEWARPDLE